MCASSSALSHACVYVCTCPCVRSWLCGWVGRVWPSPYCPAEEPSVHLSGSGRNMASLTTSSSSWTVFCIEAFFSLKEKAIVHSQICVLRVRAQTWRLLQSHLPFCQQKLQVITMICCHSGPSLLQYWSYWGFDLAVKSGVWRGCALMGMLISQY